MTETVEVLHIITPGRSVMLEGHDGSRINVTGKTVVKPGHYKGVDEKEMARMVQQGLLQKVPITSLADLPNVDLRNRTPTLHTGTEENPVDISQMGGPGLKRNLDPEDLRMRLSAGHLDLEALNRMVRERDQSMAPFDQTLPAVNWLCQESDRRPAPPAPAPAPAAPPAAPPAS